MFQDVAWIYLAGRDSALIMRVAAFYIHIGGRGAFKDFCKVIDLR